MNISEKVGKAHCLESPQKSLKTRHHSYQYGCPLRKNSLLKLWKTCFFGGCFFKWKNCWHLELLMNQIFGQRFTGRRSCLLHFIEYRLHPLNSKHTKIAVNSAIQYFEDYSQKKCLLKVWSFLVHPPQNGGPAKYLQN